MASELTWKKAIEKVLSSSPTPLHYKEISEKIISEGFRKSLGATPAATVNAHISASIKHKKEASPYVRASKGTFAMRTGFGGDSSTAISQKLAPNIPASEESEDQYEVVTSFGMFWRREAVEWKTKPRILGMQQIGADSVNFFNQLGVYLLYDGREVIYVGRTTDRPLGKRLYEHTVDRLSARWNRFSWFGLLPISDDGSIGTLPNSYVAAKLIPALEAILIEALEPRQNRKRGDDLSAVEYLQKTDSEVEKKKIMAAVSRLG